jgi:hypothetical protein
MKELIFERTPKTPYVNLNADTGEMRLVGRSIPENPEEFYEPVFNWVDDYYAKKPKKTRVNLQLEYINSGSSKFIMELLQKLAIHHHNNLETTINWYYEEDDESLLELGKHYQAMLDIPIKLIETY